MNTRLSLDETAKFLTDAGAESTEAQVVVHCMRHGARETNLHLPKGVTANLKRHVDGDTTYCDIVFSREEPA